MARQQALTLIIDGTVDPLKRAAMAAKTTLAELGSGAALSASEVEAAFAKMVSSPGDSIALMTKNLDREFRDMRRQAQQAMAQGADFNPAGGISSKQSYEAAAAIERLAQVQRDKAVAALQASTADEKVNIGLKTMATQSAAAAIGLEEQARALRLQGDAFAAMEKHLPAVVQGQQKATVGAGQMRAGMQQLGYQVGDVATQFSLGASPMVIFAGQSGQVVQALGMMTNETKGLLGFLGGPWGMVIGAAVTVLATLISNTDLFTDKTAEATKKIKQQSDATREGEVAQRAYDGTLDGLIDKERKLTDQLEKRLKTQRELNGEVSRGIGTDLEALRSEQAKAHADLARAQAAVEVARKGGAGGFGIAEAQLGQAQNNVIATDAAVLQAERNYRSSQAISIQDDVRSTSGPNGRKRRDLEEQQSALTARFQSGNMGSGEYHAAFEKLQRSIDALKPSSSGQASASSESALGGTIALIKELFPGATITSTTGGKHEKGSDHYRGRGIDFVPAGGMGSVDTDEAMAKLEAAGVKIRRNAHGTKQFFGPGRSANKPGDHDDHFHLGFEGRPTPESAQRSAESEADRKRRDADAYTQAMDRANVERAQLARDGVTDARALAELDQAAILAARQREADATKAAGIEHHWTKEQTDALQLQQAFNAIAKTRAVDEKLGRDLSAKDLQAQSDALTIKGQLLDIEGQLAPTLRERLRIALEILENDRQQQHLSNQKALVMGQVSQAEHDARAGTIDELAGRHKAVVTQQNSGPVDQYRDRLKGAAGDMNEALDGVKANGLQNLEDGLVGIISGTESVSGAFKKMAASILADLARIAVQKLILSFIGLKDGGMVPRGYATGGMVSGPGGPREDKVPAMLSAGEFVINADATRKHHRLLSAINDGQVPHFANGGMVGDVSGISYPRIPSMASMGARSVQQHFSFDMRGALTTPELLGQINGQIQRVGMAAMIGGSEMAQQEMADHRMQAIPQ